MTVITETAPRRFVAALFDLDDCLYRNAEVPALVRAKIMGYMTQKLHVAAAEVEAMCRGLYMDYGTTLAGLVAKGHQVDLEDWHAHVHGSLDYDRLLQPDIRLRELLCSIELPRFVFTNADKAHADACLERLGISDCFQGVVHFESIQSAVASSCPEGAASPGIVCKPQQLAFQLAMEQCGLKDPTRVLFLDDSVRNTQGARSLGMFTVLVGSSDAQGADVAVSDLQGLRSAMPWLLNNPSVAAMDAGVVAIAAPSS